MEILDFRQVAGRPVQAHGSAGVVAQAVLSGDGGAVTVLHVDAGGEIGRHPAPVDQLLVVVAGQARVQGGDGTWAGIGAGQAVVWRAGEEHTTRTDAGLTALVVEIPATPHD
ncbi:cupin domain-containing protein [Actinoplanes sp. NPDC049599]|uniref:cupin domain-containing protein n=1 Tax=Actinoplanes sp. NPDC049599 TaxID=3363903 RepID=UPI0037AFA24C